MNLIAPSVHDNWRNLLIYSSSELATQIWQYNSLEEIGLQISKEAWSLGWRRWDTFLSRLVMKAIMKHCSEVRIEVSALIWRRFSSGIFPGGCISDQSGGSGGPIKPFSMVNWTVFFWSTWFEQPNMSNKNLLPGSQSFTHNWSCLEKKASRWCISLLKKPTTKKKRQQFASFCAVFGMYWGQNFFFQSLISILLILINHLSNKQMHYYLFVLFFPSIHMYYLKFFWKSGALSSGFIQ